MSASGGIFRFPSVLLWFSINHQPLSIKPSILNPSIINPSIINPAFCLFPTDFPLSPCHPSLPALTYHPSGVNPLLPIAYCLLPIAYCLFPIPYCLPIFSFSLVTRHFQLATFTSSLSIHHSFNPPIINPTILTTTGSHQPSNHILYFNRKLSKII